MSKVSKSQMTRAHILDNDLDLMVSDSERVLRISANPSFLTTFNRQGQNVHEAIVKLDDALWLEDVGPQFVLNHGTTPAPDFFLQFLNNPQLGYRSDRSRRGNQGAFKRRKWIIIYLKLRKTHFWMHYRLVLSPRTKDYGTHSFTFWKVR